MPHPEKKMSIPTATLDISVEYKGQPLNNTTIQLFADGFNTYPIELGDNGRTCLILSQTNLDLTMRLLRSPKAPQDDTCKYPILGGDFPFGPITGSTRVLIIVAEPTK